jgi:hypothetical protein
LKRGRDLLVRFAVKVMRHLAQLGMALREERPEPVARSGW